MHLVLVLAILFSTSARAEEAPLQRMLTGDDSRGWEGVGRLNMGERGFCTGTLIAPDIVLTAAHCLFDKETGARFAAKDITFLADWRNGRAAAYRGIKRAVPHPEYVYGGEDQLGRVAFDLALLQLDQPILLPSVEPFATSDAPLDGEEVSVVSYAQDRATAPSIQPVCHVLGHKDEILVLSCDIDFGSSGAPIFVTGGGVPRLVSVISAKAEMDGKKVALGTPLAAPLAEVKAQLAADSANDGAAGVSVLSGQVPGGAKFLKVMPTQSP